MNQLTDICVFVTCVLLLQNVHASWWYLGIAGSSYQSTLSSPKLNYRNKCTKIAVLEPKQKELCQRSRNVLDVLSTGASMGIEECQFQFHNRRWNCTTFNTTSVFGQVLNLKSRERAYIYAISSAGMMFATTQACAKGNINICGCDANVQLRATTGDFMWGGCSHNVNFGDKFTSEFLDTKESGEMEDGLMNIWNNVAGRKSVKENMKLLCKCHGVSGSCSVKICWRTMPSFREIGAMLKEKFDGASLVKHHKKKNKLKAIDKRQKRPTKKDLVYLQESPDFCEYDADIGSLGTKERECNKTSFGLDGCTLMCCGRGYHTLVTNEEEDCNCKFFWCCRVECQKCRLQVEKHYCN